MVEVRRKKMKEKIQGPYFQLQEYSFAETWKGGSNDRYKSRSDLYIRYVHEKKNSS